MSELVIGLTIVAAGMSLPELATSLITSIYLILDSTKHDSLPISSNVLMLFILPSAILTIIVITTREIRHRRSQKI